VAQAPGIGTELVQNGWRWEHLQVFKSFWQKQSYITGFNPGTPVRAIRLLPTYLRNLRTYSQKNDRGAFHARFSDIFPILTDMASGAGTTGGHYFHQDLWAAKKIYRVRPSQHFDIGSRVDGFIAHLLVFMPVTAIDIRPVESTIEGMTFFQDDATELRSIASASISSISTLHVAEHFGLGRYTDPIDPNACFKFMASLQRVLAPGGRLYFSVPVGRERVEFNAHRVFSPRTILEQFPDLQLVSFSYVGDDGALYEDTNPLELPPSELACGLFEFTRPQSEQG
jgi:hypothetical protein